MKAPETLRGTAPTRLETFVDAAFAFAVTMLVVSVEQIPTTFADLRLALRGVPAYAAGFALIAMFWHAHYRWSRRYALEDGWSTLLSLLLVFTVLVFLYPLRIVTSGAIHAISGGWLASAAQLDSTSDFRLVFVVYGLAFACLSAIVALLFARALRVPLDPTLSAIEREYARLEVRIWWTLAGSGALSMLLALLLPGRAVFFAPQVYPLLCIVIPILAFRANRRVAALRAGE